MRRFRLYNLTTTNIETHEIDDAPPYVAISHVWAENVFDTGVESSFGGAAVRESISRILPHIQYSWMDTICIIQDDEDDKFEQIPLMSDIYRNAETVIVVLRTELGITQPMVDHAMGLVQEEYDEYLNMGVSETLAKLVERRIYPPKRHIWETILQKLEPLTQTSWVTRVWTLQEYLLARDIIWIGTDLEPVMVDDRIFGLLFEMSLYVPYGIEKVIIALADHFIGMSSLRLGGTDSTRAMEMLRDRECTQPIDSVYGVMAACGVTIEPIHGESLDTAWRRWWEAAIHQGHLRWAILLPAFSKLSIDQRTQNCIMPSFESRCNVSSDSRLDSVIPIDKVDIYDGTITFQGYRVGRCMSLKKFGKGHMYGRDSFSDHTAVLFARGSWLRAYQVIDTFAPHDVPERARVLIAQVLVDNYWIVVRNIKQGKEMNLRMVFRTVSHGQSWTTFYNDGIFRRMEALGDYSFFRATIHDSVRNKTVTTVAILGDYIPAGEIIAIGVNAFTSNNAAIQNLLLGEVSSGSSVLHKLGTTFGTWCNDLLLPETRSPQIFSIGGSACKVCQKHPSERRRIPEDFVHDSAKFRSYIAPEKVGFIVKRLNVEKAKRLKTIRRSLDLRWLIRWRRRSLCLRPMH